VSRLQIRQVGRILSSLIAKRLITYVAGKGRNPNLYTVQVGFIRGLIGSRDTMTPQQEEDANRSEDTMTPLRKAEVVRSEDITTPQAEPVVGTLTPVCEDIRHTLVGTSATVCEDIDASLYRKNLLGIGQESVIESVKADESVSLKKSVTRAAQATVLRELMLSLPCWIDREAWDAYLEMRAALKKPMTPGAYHRIVAKLESFEARGLSSTESYTTRSRTDGPAYSNHATSPQEDHMEATATQAATQRFFGALWKNTTRKTNPPKVATAPSLAYLAETLERNLTPAETKTYVAAMAELSQEENVLAFSRAATESKFFPSPATLREYSGRSVSGDPIASRSPRVAVQHRGGDAWSPWSEAERHPRACEVRKRDSRS
jgi:hypothetical protein